MEDLTNQILVVADRLTLHMTIWPLVGTGLFFTVTSRAVQSRHFPSMIRAATDSRQGVKGGISSFQTFIISLVVRVGVGNAFGVVAALLMGGPGVILWVQVAALVGMAIIFFEATPAQMFKVRAADGLSCGGPAYYISLGMKNKVLATVFTIITVATCALVITSVQSNAIAGTVLSALDDARDDPALQGPSRAQLIIAALLLVFSAMVIFDGVHTVAHVAEWTAPIMATICVTMVAIIVVMNIDQLGTALTQIVRGAVAPAPIVGGLGGGIFTALIDGTERGPFFNEVGQGTAPNAVVIATVLYSVTQRLIQSLGVFTDTTVVCTATAFITFIAGPEVWGAQGANPANFTSPAIVCELGVWTIMPMAILIFVLAYSSIIVAYVYSETNMTLVSNTKWAVRSVRVASVFSVVLGILVSLDPMWNTVGVAMTVMTVTNLVALLSLPKWGRDASRDHERQRRKKVAEPVSSGVDNPLSPTDVPTDSWRR